MIIIVIINSNSEIFFNKFNFFSFISCLIPQLNNNNKITIEIQIKQFRESNRLIIISSLIASVKPIFFIFKLIFYFFIIVLIINILIMCFLNKINVYMLIFGLNVFIQIEKIKKKQYKRTKTFQTIIIIVELIQSYL